ncbi:MAG: YggS family pyridoxal phosphate-dependent enzyme [Phycisphaerae bacterium]|nr:YggS family pyridoxal phosphate-dependent enzyme [Phycisphaerae bacterium]
MTTAAWEDRLRENVGEVRARIAAAYRRSGREPGDVTLVAVTKYTGLAVIRELLRTGCTDLGESRVQQLMPRTNALGSSAATLETTVTVDAPRWHMIGHLQRNKVKYLLPSVRIVHAVDSLRLAEQIDELAGRHGISADVLIEVNVAGEEQKYGVTPDKLPALLEELGPKQHIRLCGLMTMAPLADNPEDARPHFARLRQLLTDARDRGIVGPACRHLSMGMSQDYEIAVEEGATLVRVGSLLFEGVPAEIMAAD